MKKITLLAFLFVLNTNYAQTYCSISSDYEDVEEITSINFAGTAINNTDVTSIQVDLTSSVVNVNNDQVCNVVVSGNSYGNYDNEYVAYIDWNQNGILNDAGEEYYIGLITNSTGYDGNTATINITVPSNALIGNTRVRIVKVYTDQSDDYLLNPDPCSVSIEDVFFGTPGDIIGSYGQAVDFTLNITSLGSNSFIKNQLSVYPNPSNGIFNIDLTQVDANFKEVVICNLLGEKVFTSSLVSTQNNILNLSTLSHGIYVATLNGDGASTSIKIIKN